jgi:hypothetical protein
MFQRFASTAFVAGTLLTAFMPAVGLARDHGGNSGGGRSSSPARSARSGGSHFSGSGASHFSEARSFVSPRGPSYSRAYIAPRSYGRPVYRGYYGGGVSLGFGVPYGYGYGPGYAYAPAYPYDPGYSAGYSYGPAPAPQTCAPGTYDQYGNWVPNPSCYSGQQQYQQAPQQNYDPNQQQYQQAYPQQQQNYTPAQPQRYSR